MGFEMAPLFQCVAFSLIAQAVGNHEETGFEASSCGELMRVRVRNRSGEVVLSAIGRSYDELGGQLALACLHRITIPQLRALHLTPLRKGTPLLQMVPRAAETAK